MASAGSDEIGQRSGQSAGSEVREVHPVREVRDHLEVRNDLIEPCCCQSWESLVDVESAGFIALHPKRAVKLHVGVIPPRSLQSGINLRAIAARLRPNA
jgi:hypothetical protein